MNETQKSFIKVVSALPLRDRKLLSDYIEHVCKALKIEDNLIVDQRLKTSYARSNNSPTYIVKWRDCDGEIRSSLTKIAERLGKSPGNICNQIKKHGRYYTEDKDGDIVIIQRLDEDGNVVKV